ncbi:MAG: hypothetical protein IMW89_14965 [Ktedonobacteraceae bacterium]|nr:hypothetical protein [Ktedonobacteraceae bacterium]
MSDSEAAGAIAALTGFSLVAGIIGLALAVLMVVAWWKIFSKAGFSGALSLLLFIPIANFIVILYLAFAQWPIHNELNALRMSRDPRFPPMNPAYPPSSPPRY